MTRAPEVRLADNRRHILWSHECSYADLNGSTWHANTPLPLDDVRGWRIIRGEPLSIAPSILCRACGTHGFWRDGTWRVAG